MRVFCRLKPHASPALACLTDGSSVKAEVDGKDQIFSFDRVFGASASQQQVFDEVSELLLLLYSPEGPDPIRESLLHTIVKQLVQKGLKLWTAAAEVKCWNNPLIATQASTSTPWPSSKLILSSMLVSLGRRQEFMALIIMQQGPFQRTAKILNFCREEGGRRSLCLRTRGETLWSHARSQRHHL